jgi:hypothetical protein
MNESVSGFFVSHRDELCYTMSVSVEHDKKTTGSLRKRDTGRLVTNDHLPSLNGEVKTLKPDRVEFIVPFIRIGENYLAGEGRLLNIDINLPCGNVQMQVVGESYEMLGLNTSVAKFLISAKIAYMSEHNRVNYDYFLDRYHIEDAQRTEFALHINQR